MRYENWDVLLFPEGSKVPVQEFKTQCFVTKDTDSPYLHNPTILGPSTYFPVQSNYGQLPVLTTFVPSMPKDSPFRVSIHSWEKPRPSRLIEGLMQPEDLLLYEARVFVDGSCVAGGVFGQRSAWPYIIDIDREGNQDCLRFPAFHPEILDQRHWDAGDPFGRIRVVVAEGFARPHRSPPFERVKDVLVLSFQHAPLNILEYSNIAWPNPSMWAQFATRTSYKYDYMAGFDDMKAPDDLHGHSPGKSDSRAAPNTSSHSSGSQAVYNAWAPNRAFPVPMSQWPSTQSYSGDPRWGTYQARYQEPFMTEPIADPFINESGWHQRAARSSREDVPMPDYSSSASSRPISSMTGISYEHSKQPSMTTPLDEEQYNLLIEALTPTKASTVGIRVPSNTPSTVPAGAPQSSFKPSSAAKARRASYSRSTTRGSVLREISQSSNSPRDISGSSLKSNTSNNPADRDTASTKIGSSPSANVKGKKETAKENVKESPKKKLPAKERELEIVKEVNLDVPSEIDVEQLLEHGEDKDNKENEEKADDMADKEKESVVSSIL
ncbi:hypothetical protein N7462_000218 [Penicillium macrosclerotiorum]|uniref:uncharacterized protein n=1 Tax=Penicillium macrosclerotiorum TaxID=303699 RepID=UPI002548AEAF|nr:uncharacterized protein N7462_000218 [Penicillium macrosclerotiorum]KAJ5698213.1 hypothetical protein N7462_000218 [Penicillium macrosclerotiorum]